MSLFFYYHFKCNILPYGLCRAYNLGGAYRLLMSKPQDVEWKFARYDNPLLSLVTSDWEKLGNIEPPSAVVNGIRSRFLIFICFFFSSFIELMRLLYLNDISSRRMLIVSEKRKIKCLILLFCIPNTKERWWIDRVAVPSIYIHHFFHLSILGFHSILVLLWCVCFEFV